MKYRKLRIAWSAVCGILCLLLIVLWLRSYWRIDYFRSPTIGLEIYLFDSRFVVNWGKLWAVPGRVLSLSALPETAPTDWSKPVLGFAFDRSFVSVPLWFLALLAAAAARAPWFPWSGRFSLRTLLIGMTVVAAALGLAIASMK